MKTEKQQLRRKQIRDAAYKLLEKKGYKATSMLAIAKEAKASNETLYSWYGTKENLFRTLIEENASEVARVLEEALDSNSSVEKVLSRVGPLLLEMVTSEKAVALNRAAATDATETGELGKSLASAGRAAIAPLFHELFTRAKNQGVLQFGSKDNIAEIYINLLIGDTQIRRATGALAPLSKSDIRKRAIRATTLLLKLYST